MIAFSPEIFHPPGKLSRGRGRGSESSGICPVFFPMNVPGSFWGPWLTVVVSPPNLSGIPVEPNLPGDNFPGGRRFFRMLGMWAMCIALLGPPSGSARDGIGSPPARPGLPKNGDYLRPPPNLRHSRIRSAHAFSECWIILDFYLEIFLQIYRWGTKMCIVMSGGMGPWL